MKELTPYLNSDGTTQEAFTFYAMEPTPTEWAEWFAGCTDRFGVEWMISITGSVEFQG
jgi:uncharacterized glyoxalase superfamily protein PhnB